MTGSGSGPGGPAEWPAPEGEGDEGGPREAPEQTAAAAFAQDPAEHPAQHAEPLWSDTLGAWAGGKRVPHAPLDEASRRGLHLPATLLPAPAGADQPLVFEPALRQFGSAYRAGEPRFPDDESAHAWRRARRTALDLVLASLAAGEWAEHLVLRGGALMSTWFGGVARDPGDLDFVVVPESWGPQSPRTAELFDGLARDAAAACPEDGPVRIDAGGAVAEDIWTYERVPGRRMLLPWTAPGVDGVPGGTVQIDIVFHEPLPVPPERTRLHPLGDGPGCVLWAATPALSLAWKLVWLFTDQFPQGKDLYDAVLLAEGATPGEVTYALLRDTFVPHVEDGQRPGGHRWIDALADALEPRDWGAEYPWLARHAHEYVERLRTALRPVLDEMDAYGPYERWARWTAGVTAEAGRRPPGELGSVLAPLRRGGYDGFLAAVVAVRELRGGANAVPVEQAMEEVMALEQWSFWRDHAEYRRRVPHDLG